MCYDYVPALLYGFHSPYAASNIFCFLIRFVVCNRKLSGAHAYLSANFIYLSILFHLFLIFTLLILFWYAFCVAC